MKRWALLFLGALLLCPLMGNQGMAQEAMTEKRAIATGEWQLKLTKEEPSKEGVEKATVGKFSKQSILKWAEIVVPDTMNLGHNYHQRQRERYKSYFTVNGWESFSNALKMADIIETLEADQQDMVAQLGAFTESIIRYDKDEKQWIADIPIIVSYRSHKKKRQQNMLVTVYIVRSDEPQNGYNGVGIKQWLARYAE